jgi:hypothetical protein
MIREYDYIRDNYSIFFIFKKRDEAELLKNFLKKIKFYVYKNLVKNGDDFILAVSTRRKTIFEFVYLIIIASYYCNINNIINVNVKFRKTFKSVINLTKSLQTIFNILINYKVSVYKNNIKIDKNIFKTNIDKKNEIVINNLKIILAGEYNHFLEFLNKLGNKSKNIFIKKVINNINKKLNKQEKIKEKEEEKELIQSLLDI